MTHDIALITDSTCDIPADWKKQYEIGIVPLTIIFGNEQYLEGIELSPEDFYARIQTDPVHPTTSQPTPSSFLKAYQSAAEGGAKEILVITISSAMSGTITAAKQAAENFHLPIHFLDGKNNSMGLGWQVIAAARAREVSESAEAMIAAAMAVQKKIHYYISLDTIDYLSRGGRIADAAKFLNSFLRIKPMIFVKPETGTVGASIPARSRKAAIESLYKEFCKHIEPDLPLHLTVLHNAALEEAQELAEKVRNELNPQELFISIVSPVLGVHTGPRAIALCGYWGV